MNLQQRLYECNKDIFYLGASLKKVVPGILFGKHCSNMPCNYWAAIAT